MVHLLRGILLMDKEIIQKQGCIRRCFSTKLKKNRRVGSKEQGAGSREQGIES